MKSQQTFNREDLSRTLYTLEAILIEIQKSLPSKVRISLRSDSLFNGTFNPKMNEIIKISAEGFSSEQLIDKIGLEHWSQLKTLMESNIELQLSSNDPTTPLHNFYFYKNKG